MEVLFVNQVSVFWLPVWLLHFSSQEHREGSDHVRYTRFSPLFLSAVLAPAASGTFYWCVCASVVVCVIESLEGGEECNSGATVTQFCTLLEAQLPPFQVSKTQQSQANCDDTISYLDVSFSSTIFVCLISYVTLIYFNFFLNSIWMQKYSFISVNICVYKVCR